MHFPLYLSCSDLESCQGDDIIPERLGDCLLSEDLPMAECGWWINVGSNPMLRIRSSSTGVLSIIPMSKWSVSSINRLVPRCMVEGENGRTIRWLSIKVSVVGIRTPSGLVGNSIEQHLL